MAKKIDMRKRKGEKHHSWKGGLCANMKVYRKKYYQAHKEHLDILVKNRYLKNRESHNAKGRLWRVNNKKRCRQLTKKWRKENPLGAKAIDHRRRTKEKDLKVKTIQLVYEDNIKRYGTLTCYLCLEQIEFGKDHLEHKTPLSRGGTNDYENLAIACQTCNCKKHNRTEMEYRKLTMKEVN